MSNYIIKHGHSRRSGFSKEYKAWKNMIARCYRPSSQRFKNYGARGITVCDRWLSSFENFLADMGEAPTVDHTIDRINNDGNYEPSNCRWLHKSLQLRNFSQNRIVTIGGRSMPLVAAVEMTGLNYGTVNMRLQRGWSEERALTEPPRKW